MSSIRITAGNYRFVALPQAAAPRTVAAFTALLPYRQKIIHVRWSGEACWIPLGDFDLKTGFENHTSHPSAADILFYPGGFSETEILIAYGSCCFSSKVGQLAGNHFLTIMEGRENLRSAGRRGALGRRQGYPVREDLAGRISAGAASSARSRETEVRPCERTVSQITATGAPRSALKLGHGEDST